MTDLSNTDTDNGDKDESLASQKSHQYHHHRTSPPSEAFHTSSTDENRHYTLLDYYDLTLPLISGKSLQSLNVHSFLRTLVDFSLSHSLQLRALQKREIKFGDLSYQQIGSFRILVVNSTFPKTTQAQYSACVRHKLVELCPQFILAMYLFARFHIEDTFGELDLTEDSTNDSQLLEYKLLNGGKKLRPLSYSQQYKASTKILKFTDDFKSVNLGKILTSQINNDPKLGSIHTSNSMVKPLANSVDGILIEVLCQLAGFDSSLKYHVERAQKDPPESVFQKIFPFLNDRKLDTPGPENIFFKVLDGLRRSLVQDMVEIYKKFPDNLLCDHPIFNLEEFFKFAGVAAVHKQRAPKRSFLDDEQPSLPEEESFGADEDDERLNQGEDNEDNNEDIGDSDSMAIEMKRRSTRAKKQNKRLKSLESAVELIQTQQKELVKDVRNFIDIQAAQLAMQGRSLSDLINSTNGLSILLTAQSANRNNYARQVLDENVYGMEVIRAQITDQRNELLKSKQTWKLEKERGSLNNAPRSAPMLLATATTIAEVWEDYKNWERALYDKGLNKGEWVRGQTPAIVQLQETRSIVVNFIEKQAGFRQLPVSIVIEKLQRLMRKHQLPPSIAELSKQISDGFTIDLE